MSIARLLRRHGAALGATAAVALLAALAAGVPATSGAFTAGITNSTDTAGTATYFKCFDAILADKANALFIWGLAEASGATTATDYSGNARNGTYAGSMVADGGAPIACPRDGGTAYRLDGSTSLAYYPTSVANPQTFSIEVYFQTTAKQGVLVGFGSSPTTGSGSYDRHLYINTDGALVFGVNSTALVSPTAVTDGAWHHAVGTFTAGSMNLYLDGKRVGTSTTAGAAQSFTGYWHVGYNSIAGWAKAPSSGWFVGRMRGASVYNTVLSATQVQNHAVPAS